MFHKGNENNPNKNKGAIIIMILAFFIFNGFDLQTDCYIIRYGILFPFKKADRSKTQPAYIMKRKPLLKNYSPKDQESSILEFAGDTLT